MSKQFSYVGYVCEYMYVYGKMSIIMQLISLKMCECRVVCMHI